MLSDRRSWNIIFLLFRHFRVFLTAIWPATTSLTVLSSSSTFFAPCPFGKTFKRFSDSPHREQLPNKTPPAVDSSRPHLPNEMHWYVLIEIFGEIIRFSRFDNGFVSDFSCELTPLLLWDCGKEMRDEGIYMRISDDAPEMLLSSSLRCAKNLIRFIRAQGENSSWRNKISPLLKGFQWMVTFIVYDYV